MTLLCDCQIQLLFNKDLLSVCLSDYEWYLKYN